MRISNVILELYIDSTKTDGIEPLEVRQYLLQGDKYPFTVDAMASKNAIELAYEAVKANDLDLKDAADV